MFKAGNHGQEKKKGVTSLSHSIHPLSSLTHTTNQTHYNDDKAANVNRINGSQLITAQHLNEPQITQTTVRRKIRKHIKEMFS
jgi:hypothetical protein